MIFVAIRYEPDTDSRPGMIARVQVRYESGLGYDHLLKRNVRAAVNETLEWLEKDNRRLARRRRRKVKG